MTVRAFPQRRIQLVCIAAAVIWTAALAVFIGAMQHAKQFDAARDRHHALIKQLEPELTTLFTYHETLARLVAQSVSESDQPDFAAFVAKLFPSALPTSLETRTETLPASGLHLKTDTVKWNAIPMTSLAAIIAAAETATPPFRLTAVTLAPTGVGESRTFKAEASFTSIADPLQHNRKQP
ncbi:MAG: hypothetical protein ACOX9C_13015 [Kiritimatiellia bacterium]|jgi:hypothetical protein